MANIGFVSTSVLESKDGIDFNEEVRKESEEVKDAERIAKEAEKKPLWQQLAAQREEKQAKFDAVRAALFAPPRPLDDEESNFLEGVEAQRLEAKQRKEQWEAEELRSFAIARANQTVSVAEPKKAKSKPPAEAAADKGTHESGPGTGGRPPPVVAVKIKSKRKLKDKAQKKPKKVAIAPSSQTGKDGADRDDGTAAAGTGSSTDVGAAESSERVGRRASDGRGARGGCSAQVSLTRRDGVDVPTASAESKEAVRLPAAAQQRSDAEDGAGGLSSLLGGYGSDDSSGESDA